MRILDARTAQATSKSLSGIAEISMRTGGCPDAGTIPLPNSSHRKFGRQLVSMVILLDILIFFFCCFPASMKM